MYIRLSREDGDKQESESIGNQRKILQRYVKENNLCLVKEYVDDGISGTTFDRPSFNELLQDIENQNINMVITKDLSRLGRDYIKTGFYIEDYFPKNNIRYVAITDGIDTYIDSTNNDITPFKAIMNDMYAKDISKKIKSVKHDKQQKGQFIGGKPVYGYKMHPTEKNKIVIDEAVAPIVRRIFAMALTGMSCRRIAMVLNEEGIPTPATYCGWQRRQKGPYSGLWSSERISDMLKNETYIGNMVQGKSVKISYKSQKCIKQEQSKWIVVENTHEPLVDKETFHKVRQLLNSRKYTRSRKYDFLLKGLIFCHECGYPLAVINRKTTTGEDRLFFVCRTYQRFTKAGVCTCHCIKEQVVTDAVIEKVREICQAYLHPHRLQMIAKETIQTDKKELKQEYAIQAVHNKISSLTNNLDKMYMDRLSGLLTETDFERMYQRMKIERTTLEEKLKELERLKESPISSDTLSKELVQRFLQSAYTSRELLVSLIERIELTETKQIIIKFRFPELEAIS